MIPCSGRHVIASDEYKPENFANGKPEITTSYSQDRREAWMGCETKRFRSKPESSHALGQKFGERPHRVQLVLVQTAQFALADPFFMQEFSQHLSQVRSAELILAVNLLTALCQVLFQPPDVRGLPDPACSSWSCAGHLTEMAWFSTVDSCLPVLLDVDNSMIGL